MTEINLHTADILVQHYMSVVARNHGDAGVQAVEQILRVLRRLYQVLEPEMQTGPIYVFKLISDSDAVAFENQARIVYSLDTLLDVPEGAFALQILDDGRFNLWNDFGLDVLELSKYAVVYEYRDCIEYFYAKSEREQVQKLIPTSASQFQLQTFSDLRTALQEYWAKMVKHSTCYIFRGVWKDEKRLLLVNQPEHIMRDSLTQFLRSWLRGGVEVRPEQNMDESHPVDIKVTWAHCNRLAIIEIKWLGKSIRQDNKITEYGPVRARDGAGQLADYLDMNKQQAPEHITRGYLVIIDARRRGVDISTTTVSQGNGLWYQHKEISFDPEYHKVRSDFDEPIRMFTEPLCQ